MAESQKPLTGREIIAVRKKIVVALSGGLDSSTLLAYAVTPRAQGGQGYDAVAVGVHYGSKHNGRELAAARDVASKYNVPYYVLDMRQPMQGFRSALMTNSPTRVPYGHYEAESMRQTVVPGRNMIFISLMAGLAESLGRSEVWLGVHAGDHHIYPDCRPEFVRSMNSAVLSSSENKVRLQTPYLNHTKAQILFQGLSLAVPYELTWTCYEGGEVACGLCGSCRERLESFGKANVPDPLPYADETYRVAVTAGVPEDAAE